MAEPVDEDRLLGDTEEMGRALDEGLAELRRMAHDVDGHGNPIALADQRWAIQQLVKAQSKLLDAAPIALQKAVEIACKDPATSNDPSSAEARHDARTWLVERGLVFSSESDTLTEEQLLALINLRIGDARV